MKDEDKEQHHRDEELPGVEELMVLPKTVLFKTAAEAHTDHLSVCCCCSSSLFDHART